MFVPMLIVMGMIFVGGPLHHEGGAKAIETKGVKVAIQDAIKDIDRTQHENNARYN